MKNFWIRLTIFLLLNFGALALGSLFTSDGVTSEWYQSLHKAPWTPPGFVFGLAWTLIMICFGVYMAIMSGSMTAKNMVSLIILYIVQWSLNVLWNPTFFFFHEVTLALYIIVALFLLVSYFMYIGFKRSNLAGVMAIPYVVWLAIATSLNAYILFNN